MLIQAHALAYRSLNLIKSHHGRVISPRQVLVNLCIIFQIDKNVVVLILTETMDQYALAAAEIDPS